MELEFKIFSLNCWGIAGVSKDKNNRMLAISEALANSNYDVVCLQEVWMENDFFAIRDRVAEVLPYSHYFYSGVVGSGICIFSKHPIWETFFHQWPLNGYIHKLQHGDWFGGKGVVLCKLAVNHFIVNIYSAHLHAEYNQQHDEYKAHRILQAYDTAQFIMLTSRHCDLVVLAADLNTKPGDLAYRLMLTIPGLVDAFSGAKELPKEDVSTCDSLRNSYTPRKLVKKNLPGDRIDYILYHPGSKLQVDLKEYRLPLPERVPNRSYSFSDHEAISATLVVSTKRAQELSRDSEDKYLVLEECLVVLNSALSHLVIDKIIYSLFTFILFVLLIVSLIFHSPFGYTIIFNIFRVFITAMILYFFVMATLWNQIERHGVLSAKLAMEVSLRQFRKDL